jgi:hypothetical protein
MLGGRHSESQNKAGFRGGIRYPEHFSNHFTDESDINIDIDNMSLMGVNEEEGTTLQHLTQTSHHARGYHCAMGGPPKMGEHCTD